MVKRILRAIERLFHVHQWEESANLAKGVCIEMGCYCGAYKHKTIFGQWAPGPHHTAAGWRQQQQARIGTRWPC